MCPTHIIGCKVMKKKILFAASAIVVSVATIIGLSSFTSNVKNETGLELSVQTHVSCQGKHCTYTVGCDCSGFSPKTDGKEWEKSYCKRCGHHKKYHK